MRSRVSQKIILFCLAFVGLVLLIVNVRLSFNSVSVFNVPASSIIIFGGLAVLLQMVGHWLRAVKHRYLLEQIRPIRTPDVFKGQMVGLLFNAVLPFRIGEIIRAHYIGKRVSISRAAVFATIMFERLIDAALLTLVAVIIIATNPFNSVLVWVAGGLLIAVLGLGYGMYAINAQKKWLLSAIYRSTKLFNKRVRDRLRMVFWSGIYGLMSVLQRANMRRYLALSGVMWLCYALSVYVFIAGVWPNAGLQPVAAAYLGVSAPTGPAYLGSFQEIFIAISGLPSYFLAFGLWLLFVGPTSLLGLLFLASFQKSPAKQDAVLETLKNKLYRDADITREFSQFLDAYFRGDRINHILHSQELAKEFQIIKTYTGGSSAVTLLAWQDNTMVVKKITLKQHEDKLRAQYVWLKEYKKLKRIPKLLGEHRKHPDYYAIDIEYRENYIPFFDVIHSSSVATSKAVLMDVCQYVARHIHQPQKKRKNMASLVRSYITQKAVGKITDSASANVDIAHLLGYETIVVNGREIVNFQQIIERILAHPKAMADLQEITESPLQGDLTVDNLIVDPATHEYLILDPNNENSISDPVVDYAKLTQSLHSGYEFLRTLDFCSITDNTVTFEERRSVQYDQLFKALSKHLQEELTPGRYRALLFHEAIHYCRMLTYRTTINPDTAAVFYCIAVRLFNNFMEQYDVAED